MKRSPTRICGEGGRSLELLLAGQSWPISSTTCWRILRCISIGTSIKEGMLFESKLSICVDTGM